MEIDAPLLGWLVLLHRDAVGLGVGILADAGYLPGDLQPRLTFLVFVQQRLTFFELAVNDDAQGAKAQFGGFTTKVASALNKSVSSFSTYNSKFLCIIK